MRLISYEHNGKISWGALQEDDSIIDLTGVAPSLKAAIEQGKLSNIDLAGQSAAAQLEEVRLLAPIIAPEKIACIGVNYANRS